jgi:predicted amidophosphoribosyltransferase
MPKTCGSCGLVISDDARFCEKCGYQFASAPKANIPGNGANRKENASLLIVAGYLCTPSAVQADTVTRRFAAGMSLRRGIGK